MATLTLKVRLRGFWRMRFWMAMFRIGQALRLNEDRYLLPFFRKATGSLRVETTHGRKWTLAGTSYWSDEP